MTAKTDAQLTTSANADIADNTTGDISASDVRSLFIDVIDSKANLTSASLVTPSLGVATATSINKVAITAPASSATLTIADGKTLTASNTLTFTGTDSSSVAFGGGGTVLYSGGALGTPSSGTLTNATGLPAAGVVGTAAILGANTFTGDQTLASAGQLLWSTDLILTRKAAASLRLGAADAASPVAQTLGVQGVVAGTSNTAGAAFTLAGSQGTGTGAGGSIVFQTAAAGGSGSSQNALAAVFTLNSAGSAIVAGAGSTSVSALSINAGVTGLSESSGTLVIRVSGSLAAGIGTNGSYIMGATAYLGWSSSTPFSGATDTFLGRLAAASFLFGGAAAASPVAQTIGFQGSRSGTDSNVGGANATINPSIGTGTGTPANLIFNGIVGAASGTGAQTTSAAITIAGVLSGQVPSIVLGAAAIATNATSGFLYIASCAGTPTGTPTSYTGRVPMVWDSTNKKFYVYDGAWLGGTAPGVFS